MARTKTEKRDIIEKVKKIADGAQSLVFVNFHGLKVSGATEVRRKLKSQNIGFFVAKKTLMSKALEDSVSKKISGTMPTLEGEVGVAYGTDLIAPAREILVFQNKFKAGKDGKGGIVILGGIFDGRYMTREEMLGIALIPSLSTLHGMFVNVIASPIQGLVVALDQIAKQKVA